MVGGFGRVAFFGGQDDSVLNQHGDGCDGEPVAGLVEMAARDGRGELPGKRVRRIFEAAQQRILVN